MQIEGDIYLPTLVGPQAEAQIIATLERLLSLAEEARLTETIAYLAVCRTLVKLRRKHRMADLH